MSTKKNLSLENIRPFTTEDYEALAKFVHALYPDHSSSAREMRFSDEHRDAKVLWRRWVWEEDGRIVARGSFSQEAYAYHPQRFWIEVLVHPDFQGRGIGSAFYDFLEREVAAHDPIKLQAETVQSFARLVVLVGRIADMAAQGVPARNKFCKIGV